MLDVNEKIMYLVYGMVWYGTIAKRFRSATLFESHSHNHSIKRAVLSNSNSFDGVMPPNVIKFCQAVSVPFVFNNVNEVLCFN